YGRADARRPLFERKTDAFEELGGEALDGIRRRVSHQRKNDADFHSGRALEPVELIERPLAVGVPLLQAGEAVEELFRAGDVSPSLKLLGEFQADELPGRLINGRAEDPVESLGRQSLVGQIFEERLRSPAEGLILAALDGPEQVDSRFFELPG